MDALGVILCGAGAFLLYEAYKGGTPWADFLDIIGGKQTANAAAAATADAAGAGPGTSVGNSGAVGSAAEGSVVNGVKVH